MTLLGPNAYSGAVPAKSYSDHINVDLKGAYYIDVINGTPQDADCHKLTLKCFLAYIFHKPNTNRVDSAEININGRIVVSKLTINERIDRYTGLLNLNKGSNSIAIKVQGKAGSLITVVVKEVVIAKKPTAKIKIVSAAKGTAPFTALFDSSGTSDPNGLPLTYKWDFGDGETSNASGLVTHEFMNTGNYNVKLTVKDAAGLDASAQASIKVIAPTVPPPISVTGAPPAPTSTSVGSLSDSVSFLYSGPNAVQTGVQAGAIDVKRTAVLKGKVLDENGAPLPGAEISVAGAPQFGHTFSQSDGQFDMVVNGGGNLSISYMRSGYLPSQRTVTTKFQDYFTAPDVIMVRPDPKVTVVSMGATTTQVAQGSPQTDTSGSRTATVMIPSGTTAQLVMPNGSTMSMPQLSLRATEFTVGANGPKRMPGTLPKSTSYTYAVDLSSDEGAALGAQHIQFSQAVPVYVDNFLGFPTGVLVPVGVFNANTGLWDPQENGRVISIRSIQNGLAILDVTGGGTATANQLAELGITTEEQRQLAKTYSAGQSLWRMRTAKFSAFDMNYVAVGAGTEPNRGNPVHPTQPENDCSGAQTLPNASTILTNSQVLLEEMPIVGTPYTLNYSSQRAFGRSAERTLLIPVTGDLSTQLPGLNAVSVEVDVAGQTYSQDFAVNVANQFANFTWDGKDSFGRVLNSAQPASVRVQFKFDADYIWQPYLGSNLPIPVFAQIDGAAVQSTIVSRIPDVLEADFHLPIGTQSAKDEMAGWLINVHHFFDPASKILYFGNGVKKDAADISSRIETVGGTDLTAFSPDGTVAKNAPFNAPFSVFVASDGSIYFSELTAARIRKIDSNGILSTVAGIGTSGFSGDNGPATQARISSLIYNFTEGPDHSIYFSDTGNQCIRRISPSGTISTVAGGGSSSENYIPATSAALSAPRGLAFIGQSLYFVDSGTSKIWAMGPNGTLSLIAGIQGSGFGGDGGSASQALFKNPTGLVASADGDLYIADTGNQRIRKITKAGTVSTYAGNGSTGNAQGTQAALDANFTNPTELTMGPDNVLYVLDTGNYRIRTVTPDGFVHNFAGGNGISGVNTLDGTPASSAGMSPHSLAFRSDGSIFYVDATRIRMVTSGFGLPVAGGQYQIPSDDGSEIYVFASNGQHLRTLNGLTGATKLTFGYDSNQRLISITDAFNNVTQIGRGSDGRPTQITSPYGQSSQLSVDANGYLSSMTNPNGETYSIQYSGEGLMSQFTKPNGGISVFTYDDLGQLTKDQNPGGGFISLIQTANGDGYQVNMSTAMNRTSQTSIAQVPFYPNNQSVPYIDALGNTSTTTTTDAMSVTYEAPLVSTSVQLASDPVLGLPVTYAAHRTISKQGLLQILDRQKTIQSSDPSNLFAYQSLETTNINGNVWTAAYDGVNHSFTHTSPMGRVQTSSIDEQGDILQSQIGNLTPSTFSYDPHGRLSSVQQGNRYQVLSYDSRGNLASVSNALNQTTSYSYDNAGRTTQIQMPDGRQIAMTYDRDGNMTSITPPGRQPYGFIYNLFNFVSSFQEPQVGSSASVTQYTYNLDKQLTSMTRPDGSQMVYNYDVATPKLLTATTPQGSYSYQYNSFGQIVNETSPDSISTGYTYVSDLVSSISYLGPSAFYLNQQFTYNSNFRKVSSMIAGVTFNYAYDKEGLMVQAGPMTIRRDPQTGLVVGTTLGQLQDSYSYNSYGELVGYTAGNLYSLSLTRDNLGRVTNKTETIQGQTTSRDFTYDSAGRLIKVVLNGTNVNTYSYDSNGNRIAATINGQNFVGTYDAQDRIQTYGANTYVHDANGQMISKTDSTGTYGFSYDINGRLSVITFPDGETQKYIRNAKGYLVGRYDNGVLAAEHLAGPDGRNHATYNTANGMWEIFGFGTGRYTPDFMYRSNNQVYYRIVTDDIGSVRLVVNANNLNVAQRIDYDEFGQISRDDNPGFQFYSFAGGHIANVMLMGTDYRFYSSDIGRWTTKDPIGFNGGDTNLYGYVLNDPVNRIDPLGLQEALPEEGDMFEFLEQQNRPEDQGPLDPPDWCILGHCDTRPRKSTPQEEPQQCPIPTNGPTQPYKPQLNLPSKYDLPKLSIPSVPTLPKMPVLKPGP